MHALVSPGCTTLYTVHCTLYTVHCSTLYYTVHFTTLYHSVLHCATLQYTVLHYTTLYYTVLHCTTLYYTVHCTVHCCTILHQTWNLSQSLHGLIQVREFYLIKKIVNQVPFPYWKNAIFKNIMFFLSCCLNFIHSTIQTTCSTPIFFQCTLGKDSIKNPSSFYY